jgi:hypothetical protein
MLRLAIYFHERRRQLYSLGRSQPKSDRTAMLSMPWRRKTSGVATSVAGSIYPANVPRPERCTRDARRLHSGVESKRERMKKLNCLSIQEKENTKLIYREKTILGEAEYHNRSPKPSTSAGARPPPQHGGRRGPLGPQATGLMPAALGQWGL